MMKFVYIACAVCLISMAVNTYFLEEELNTVIVELEAAKAENEQLKTINEYQAKFIAFAKEVQEENSRRQKEIEDVLSNNKDWAGAPLPVDVQRVFDEALRTSKVGNPTERTAN